MSNAWRFASLGQSVAELDLAYLPTGILGDGVDTAGSERPYFEIPDGNVNTEGSKTEIEPSLSADCGGIILTVIDDLSDSSVDNRILARLYTGGVGVETAWGWINVAGLPIGHQVYVPGFWPAGTRLSLAFKTVTGNRNPRIIPIFIPADVQYFSASPAEDIGFGANSDGTAGSTGFSPNAKTAWTQLVAATTNDLAALIVGINAAAGSIANNSFLFDIGIGAGGAETVLIGDIAVKFDSTEKIYWHSPQTYLVDVPAGSRLSFRCQCTSIAVGFGCSLTGVRPA